MDTRKAVIVYPPSPDFCQLFQPFFKTVRFGFLSNLLEPPPGCSLTLALA
jgi:hypothetical protein